MRWGTRVSIFYTINRPIGDCTCTVEKGTEDLWYRELDCKGERKRNRSLIDVTFVTSVIFWSLRAVPQRPTVYCFSSVKIPPPPTHLSFFYFIFIFVRQRPWPKRVTSVKNRRHVSVMAQEEPRWRVPSTFLGTISKYTKQKKGVWKLLVVSSITNTNQPIGIPRDPRGRRWGPDKEFRPPSSGTDGIDPLTDKFPVPTSLKVRVIKASETSGVAAVGSACGGGRSLILVK